MSERASGRQRPTDYYLKALQKFVEMVNPAKVYETLLSTLTEWLPAYQGLVIVCEPKSHSYQVRASSIQDSQDVNFSRGIVNDAVEKKQARLIRNAKYEQEFKNNPSIIGKVFLTALCVPLTDDEGNIAGALYLDRIDSKAGEFTEADLEWVKEIAWLIAPLLFRDKERQLQLYARALQLGMIVSEHSKMLDVIDLIERTAKTNSTVLITGESGTGKELVAHAIHQLSTRKKQMLVAVNCGGIASELIESELFGHEKGAFTGAIQQKIGKFELADHGTLFLDEIAEIPIKLQSKLLRALQEKDIDRVGGTKTIKVDVRFIAATHQNLQKAIQAEKFRQDLYYRLDVLTIHIPALRERTEDIIPLAEFFLKKISQAQSKHIAGFSRGAIHALQDYEWPGNVRELQNLMEKVVTKLDDDALVTERDLFPQLYRGTFSKPATIPYKGDSIDEYLANIERDVIKATLDRNEWNIAQTARDLGYKQKNPREVLYERMKKLDLTRDV